MEPTKDSAATAFDVSDLDYELPEGRIAQRPAPTREGARLLVVDRATGGMQDTRIARLPEFLEGGDLLVLNDTKVLPAKFTARRKTGGLVPGLFVAEEEPQVWRVILQGSKRLRIAESLAVAAGEADTLHLHLEKYHGDGHWRVQVDSHEAVDDILSRIGRTPLPPYIHRRGIEPVIESEDRQRYQTVYARRAGAIAAPTAGLHLTGELLDQLGARGVAVAFVTLHIGVGTFKPITADRLADHVMHIERYELSEATADAVRACRQRGGRVVAVGTTSVRVLESAATEGTEDRLVRSRSGVTDLFVYPPHHLCVVDALLTNFHLPRTTLLALVMAFAGVETTRQAYRHAIDHEYRFYSYGDAMLIH